MSWVINICSGGEKVMILSSPRQRRPEAGRAAEELADR